MQTRLIYTFCSVNCRKKSSVNCFLPSEAPKMIKSVSGIRGFTCIKRQRSVFFKGQKPCCSGQCAPKPKAAPEGRTQAGGEEESRWIQAVCYQLCPLESVKNGSSSSC